MEDMDKICEDLEDAARQHTSKILCWHLNKLKGSSQSGLVPGTRMGPKLVIRKELRKDGGTFSECAKPRYSCRKDIDQNEKVCDTFDVKEDLFREEELATALKGLKNK